MPEKPRSILRVLTGKRDLWERAPAHFQGISPALPKFLINVAIAVGGLCGAVLTLAMCGLWACP
jgi:hypothetical protein